MILSDHCPGNQGRVRESEKWLKHSEKSQVILYKNRKVREKSWNLNRLSERKSSTIHLSFYQNIISRSQENLSEVREQSGKSQGKVREDKSRKSCHPARKYETNVLNLFE